MYRIVISRQCKKIECRSFSRGLVRSIASRVIVCRFVKIHARAQLATPSSFINSIW